MKRKLLLFTILTIVGALGSNLYAQEDVTDTYLQNAGLASLEGWDYGDEFNGGTYTYSDYRPDATVPVIEFYHSWSANAGAPVSPTKNFHFTQKVTLPAGNYRLAVNGFYREGNGNGTNTKAYIFAGEKQQYMHGLTAAEQANISNPNGIYSGGLNSDLGRAAVAFSQGDFSNEFDFDVEEEQEITIGFKGYIDTYCSWCILGPVKLYKYSLDDYLVDWRKWVAEAEALYDSPMNADVLSELQAAVVEESTFQLAKDVSDAITILKAKIAAAEKSIEDYAATKAALTTYDAKAAQLDQAGQAAYNDAVASIRSAYNDRSMVGNQSEAVKAAYQAAVKLQTAPGSDYTECAPTSWVGQKAYYGARPERYETYVYTGDVMTQTIEGVPAGAYEIVLEAAASTTTSRDHIAGAATGTGLTVVFANEQTTDIEVVSQTAASDFGPYTVVGKVGSDGVLKYGLKNIAEGGNWFVVNLVSITKVEYVPVTAVEAEDVTVEVTATAPITATVTPTNATFPEVKYTSGDETVATVDADGVVTGVAVGATTITLTADEKEKVINVTVTEPAVLPESIQLSATEFALGLVENNSATLTASVLPEDASQDVAFSSSDESVATVSEEGVITAVGLGSAVITVTSKAKEDVTATATVTVSAAEAPAVFSSTLEDGTDYWLMNAATGRFLGGANSWGTRASLIKHGIPFKATKVEDGVYTLDSYTSNGGNSHYLAGEWIDGNPTNLTITSNSNGSFSVGIANGETVNYLKAKTSNTEVDLIGNDANDAFSQWYFISTEDWMTMLEDASETNPVDATFLVKDFNFSRNNNGWSAWEKENITLGLANGQNAEANNTFNWNVESYHKVFSMNQTIVVPNGIYRLTAQGFYRQDGDDNENLPYFYANDEQQTFPKKDGSENSMTDAAHSFQDGAYTIDPITVEVTDRVLKIGALNEVNTSLWCIFDNFELEMIGMSDKQDIEVTVGSTGYATMFYENLNLVIPSDVKASTATIDGTKVKLTELEGTVPAATGVVLNAEPGTYQFAVSTDEVASAENNVLVGTDKATTIKDSGYKYYVLSVVGGDASTIGFYYDKNYPDGSGVDNGAHKAYLAVETSAAAGITSFLLETDGIDQITSTLNGADNVYTISGIKVNNDKLPKGIYIVDGKKVVVK